MKDFVSAVIVTAAILAVVMGCSGMPRRQDQSENSDYIIPVGSWWTPQGITSADFNSDGKPDIAIVTNGSIEIYLNPGW